jgi:hypothetical protein
LPLRRIFSPAILRPGSGRVYCGVPAVCRRFHFPVSPPVHT